MGEFGIEWYLGQEARSDGVAEYTFEGIRIYASHNPANPKDDNFSRWVRTWLAWQPGVHVECLERKPKPPPRCPVCHRAMSHCAHPDCQQPLEGSVEKGVDVLLASDLVRLAWDNAYDVAVLATSDSDLLPAVETLAGRGVKVIHAGIPPAGGELAAACWARIDVGQGRDAIQRAWG